LALEDFHFGVEAFGDPIVAGEAPHGSDFVPPGMQGITELNQLSKGRLFQFCDHAQQTGRQFRAPSLVLMFFQQQIAKPLFESVNQFQKRMLFEISGQSACCSRSRLCR
jgi:hypothetical protein